LFDVQTCFRDRDAPNRDIDFMFLNAMNLVVLTGLPRVRRFQQDDAHICRVDQVFQLSSTNYYYLAWTRNGRIKLDFFKTCVRNL
jgi:hypothetical protein